MKRRFQQLPKSGELIAGLDALSIHGEVAIHPLLAMKINRDSNPNTDVENAVRMPTR
jgi:hypothetical protein